MAYTLAYYAMELIMAEKGFVIPASAVAWTLKLFTAVIYSVC